MLSWKDLHLITLIISDVLLLVYTRFIFGGKNGWIVPSSNIYTKYFSNANLMKNFVMQLQKYGRTLDLWGYWWLKPDKFYTWAMKSIIWLLDDFLISSKIVF